jgi:hypothetical protein
MHCNLFIFCGLEYILSELSRHVETMGLLVISPCEVARKALTILTGRRIMGTCTLLVSAQWKNGRENQLGPPFLARIRLRGVSEIIALKDSSMNNADLNFSENYDDEPEE